MKYLYLLLLIFSSCAKIDLRPNEPHIVRIEVSGSINDYYPYNTRITVFYHQVGYQYFDMDKWITLDNSNENTVFGGSDKCKFNVTDMKPDDSILIDCEPKLINGLNEVRTVSIYDNGKNVFNKSTDNRIKVSYKIK